MRILKKEATDRKYVTTVTVDTGVKMAVNYTQAEKVIKTDLRKMYNMYTGTHLDRVVEAWEVQKKPNSWNAFTVKQYEEYEWLVSVQKDQKPIVAGIISIFANSSTRTWWMIFVMVENNEEFMNPLAML